MFFILPWITPINLNFISYRFILFRMDWDIRSYLKNLKKYYIK